MVEQIRFSNEWTELAKDGPEVVLEKFDHSVVIGGDRQVELATKPTSVRDRRAINKARNLSLPVPPNDDLIGTDYLGEPFKFYVGGELAFSGEIISLDTSQRDGKDYNITARPQGQKLKGSDVERTIESEIVSDTMANLIDEYNDYDSEKADVEGTSSEIFNDTKNLGGGVVGVTDGNTTGTITYTDVGNDASDLDVLYLKIYANSTNTVDVTIDDGTTTYDTTFQTQDLNIYGQWASFRPEISNNASYDITFQLEGDALLIDWISITNERIGREVTDQSVSELNSNVNLYTKTGTDFAESAKTPLPDGIVQEGDGFRTRHVAEYYVPDSLYGFSDEEGVGGFIANINPEDTFTYDRPFFSLEDTFEDWRLAWRIYPYAQYHLETDDDHLNQGLSEYFGDWGANASASTNFSRTGNYSTYVTGDEDVSMRWDSSRGDTLDPLTLRGYLYFDSSDTVASTEIGFTDGTSRAYGIQLNPGSNSIELESGSSDIDTSSLTIPEDEWVFIELKVDDGGDVDGTVTTSAGTANVSASDSAFSTFDGVYCDTSGNVYLDDIIAGANLDNIGGVDLNITVAGGTINDFGLSTSSLREWNWDTLAEANFSSSFNNEINSTDVEIEMLTSSERGVLISPFVLLHDETKWDLSSFDNTIHADNGHLDDPPRYATNDRFNTSIEFSEFISQENITSSTTDATFDSTTDTFGEWGISQVIDGGVRGFSDPTPSTSVTDDYSYPGIAHAAKITLTPLGQRDTDTPRKGFNSQTVTDYSVDVDTNDLQVFYDKDISNNRLSALNSIANNSTAIFRFEGELIKIFHFGQETTDLEIRGSSIDSSVSIEDVYDSCEVIGLHNVRSGIVQAQNPPTFVDYHKTIRSDNITSESDCLNEAVQFLQKHGTVQYKGTVETMPTYAPLGALVNGDNFNHGQDMIVREVSYSKDKTTVKLGRNKNIANQLISIEGSQTDTKTRTTGSGMIIPVGEDQV